MNRLQKLVDQIKQEIESASLYYDIDELVDAFEAFEEVVERFFEENEEEEE